MGTTSTNWRLKSIHFDAFAQTGTKKNKNFPSVFVRISLKKVQKQVAKHQIRKFRFLYQTNVNVLWFRTQKQPDLISDDMIILAFQWLVVNGKVSGKPTFCQNISYRKNGYQVMFMRNEPLLNGTLFWVVSDSMFDLLYTPPERHMFFKSRLNFGQVLAQLNVFLHCTFFEILKAKCWPWIHFHFFNLQNVLWLEVFAIRRKTLCRSSVFFHQNQEFWAFFWLSENFWYLCFVRRTK